MMRFSQLNEDRYILERDNYTVKLCIGTERVNARMINASVNTCWSSVM